MTGRRRLSLAAALLLAAPAAVFCSGSQEAATTASEPVTLTVMLSESSTVKIDPEAPGHKAITEKTGIRINWEAVPASDYTQKVRTLIATNSVPDIALIAPADYNDFGYSGAFLELDGLIEKHIPNFKAVMGKNAWINKLRIDGKLFTFPTVSRDDVTKAPLMFIRTDLLKKHNLAVPTTFDELYRTLAALKKAYPTSVPLTCRGSGSLGDTLYSLGTGAGLYFDPDVSGGSYVYGPASTRYRDALAYLNRLYSEKILDPDYAVTSMQQWVEKNSGGKGFFGYDNPIYIVRMNSGLKTADPNAAFEMIPVVQSAGGLRRFLMYIVHPTRYWVIGSRSTQAVEAARLFNWLYSDEGCDIRSFGIEGVHYDRVNGRNVFKKELLDKYAAQGDAYTGIQSAVGIAFATFVPYYDNELLKVTQIPEVQKWWFQDIANDPDRDYPTIDPQFSPAQRERVKDIKAALGTLEKEAFDKFIMGAWPMSQFDDIAKKMRELGATELEKIYNDASAAYR